MPRSSHLPRSFNRSVLALAGMLVAASIAACASLDRTPVAPTFEPTPTPTPTDRPRLAQEADGEGNASILQRWLPDLLGAASASPAGLTAGNDGYIQDGVSISPFESEHAAIANLDRALLDAIQRAALDARRDGIEIGISSGWRSARYQQHLLDEAVKRHGSKEEARRFVNTPAQSTHVTGDAVDIAPMDAMSWLSQRGAAYGLCQTYANEMWHYELMTEPGGICPPQLSDAAAG